MYKLPKIITNLILRIFWGLKIEGKQNIPQSRGFILLLNRVNFFECLVLEAVISTKIYWAVSELGRSKPFSRWFLLRLGCFPLDTANPDVKGFRFAFAVLQRKKGVAFYPLGLTKGIALFCLRSGNDVLPAACIRQRIRPRLKVLFGPVYNFQEYQNSMLNADLVGGIIQQVRNSIENLTSQ